MLAGKPSTGSSVETGTRGASGPTIPRVPRGSATHVNPNNGSIVLLLSLFLLLLVFFIVLNAQSVQTAQKVKAVAASLEKSFPSFVIDPRLRDGAETVASRAGTVFAVQRLDSVGTLFATAVAVAKVETVSPGRLLEVRLPADDLFLPGTLTLRPDRQELLDRVVDALRELAAGRADGTGRAARHRPDRRAQPATGAGGAGWGAGPRADRRWGAAAERHGRHRAWGSGRSPSAVQPAVGQRSAGSSAAAQGTGAGSGEGRWALIRVPGVGGGKQGHDPGGHRKTMWLISFTDLISLMLAFFVLMYSMSEPESQRWIRLTRGLSDTIPAARSTATTPSDRPADPRAAFNAQAVEVRAAIDLNYLGALLRTQIGANAELAAVEVRREDDRVVIGLPGERMFDETGALFTDPGRRVLFLLGAVVGRIGNRIEVVGHAEREDQTAGAAWERALTRAVAVSAALRETGYQRDLVARAVMAPLDGGGRVRVDIVVREEGAD